MAELASHYEKIRNLYPQDRLLILFDIDGTILDMRYMIHYVLTSYDLEHGTDFFKKLKISKIKVHENQVATLLKRLELPEDNRKEILEWYNQFYWSSESLLESHRPFSGVLEVVRWFQLQPNTFVGLNTGRPESLREITLRSLNQLGKEYKVQFTQELLHMNPSGWEEKIEEAKVAGVRSFRQKGYRVFAFIDNEPANLESVSKIDPDHEILFLHADTIFLSKRTRLPSNTVKGREYDLTELIPEKALPQHIQFVWHGINDGTNLLRFLSSDIAWGECDVQMDPIRNELILHHDSLSETSFDLYEEWNTLDQLLSCMYQTGKSIKIDLKNGGILVDKVLESVEAHAFEDYRLWFNGKVEKLQERGFRKLYKAYPHAIIQCPVGFLAPLICSAPEKAKEILDMFTSWGINRFSINWQAENMRTFLDQMDQWGYEVNVYNVPDLVSFLQAALLLPRSITSDFNFPKWQYYGRGSEKNGRLLKRSHGTSKRRRKINQQ